MGHCQHGLSQRLYSSFCPKVSCSLSLEPDTWARSHMHPRYLDSSSSTSSTLKRVPSHDSGALKPTHASLLPVLERTIEMERNDVPEKQKPRDHRAARRSPQ